MMWCHLTVPTPAEQLSRLVSHPNLTALAEDERSFIAPLARSQEPRRALHCHRSLNGFCGAADYVEHRLEVEAELVHRGRQRPHRPTRAATLRGEADGRHHL